MGQYDDLMNAAKKKLEYEKNGTLNEEAVENENDDDIYASFRDELEEDEGKQTNKKKLPNIDSGIQENKDINIQPTYTKEDYYIDENDTPLFEGGPGIGKIQLWKKQYGIDKIYHTVVLDRHFIFRTLNRSEYEQIASLNLDSLTNEELICKQCVLFPFNYNYEAMAKDGAGYPHVLAAIIQENSGFTSNYQIEVL